MTTTQSTWPAVPDHDTTAATGPAAEQAVLDRVPRGLLIDGHWVDAADGATFDVVDPATGDVLARIADATPADGLRALDAADAARHGWATTPPRQRAEVLRRAFDLLQERREEFALLMTLEMGKPLAEARGEVTYGGEFLRWFSEEAVRIGGDHSTNPEGTGRAFVTHKPVGPALLITPWNFPLAMATRKVAPALAAGCTVVVKPAELTPLTTLLFADLLLEAGVPAGVVNVVPTTTAGDVCGPVIADPRLRKLSFTGSTPVGRTLLAQAAQNVLRTSMELGGNAPFLVFEDADLDLAVDAALAAKFRNTGQACTAANRFLVHEDVAAEFADRVTARVGAMRVGRGTEDGVAIGPLIDDRAVAKADRLVTDAVERGAVVRTGGHPVAGPGTFYAPTVLTDVQPGSAILDDEIFGPVLAIRTFRTEDEAVAAANDTEYGLIAYACTEDPARGQRLMETLETGMLGLNTGVVSNAAAPFGGVKQSGTGREGGAEGIAEYLETMYTLTPDPFRRTKGAQR
ncbi:NAD-dependent succinate-semialdehyde dehydrogenase [Curtobacterium sp. 'Ferrero']|uniref:NAD-dependent succinate-semialdehyde dehydrogenase n=1 Tax=Curtobacterium sp. 'Ferrero' TaxID=2033654 RepID=UPI000BC6FDED|nr:NAD-dependent succinate-semialdehyde dehydrogenase [Curtobacterium sp. 'Ferrero']PCN48827.1 NAD-dependent succinate-semialdehyde dehydrogenase [Curtobacterium sp. 'Ferrero']